MVDTLPRDDDESARRLAALDADLAGQIRRQWIAKHGDVTHRVIDRESHATNPPGHKQAWTRGQRHHRREFGYED